MNNSRLLVLLFLTLLIFSIGCSQPEPQTASADIREESNGVELEKSIAVLKQRIERLEVEQARLVEQLDQQAARGIEMVAEAGSIEPEKIEGLIEAEVAERVDSIQQRQVAEIALQEIKSYEERKAAAEEAEREAIRQEREARRQEREAERVGEIAQELGLNDQQAEELLAARAGLQTTIREVFDYMREQGDFDRDVMRETMGELREQHEQILAEFMTDEQLKSYLEQHGFNASWNRRGRSRR